MIAAIYARKSTDQTGIADEQKSVARQVDHAKKYAAGKGWAVDEGSVFIDAGAVLRVINEAEAVIVREIFDRCGRGQGRRTIAHALNDQRAPSPRAQQGRAHGWCASSVREVLYRPLYRGEIVWNRTRKRN